MYKLLNKINRVILPSFIYKDLTRLSKLEKLIIGYRIWLAKKTLK